MQKNHDFTEIWAICNVIFKKTLAICFYTWYNKQGFEYSGVTELVGLACGLGLAPALTVHRTVIHYRSAASLRAGLNAPNLIFAGVMELADVTDSKSVGLITRAGSTPATGTIPKAL